MREAIKILSALGRIKAQKGRGLYVADDDGMLGMRWGGFFLPTDLDHIYMLFEFRRVQEAEASRLAATRATPTELRAIGAAEQTVPGGTRDRAAGTVPPAATTTSTSASRRRRTTRSLSRRCARPGAC